MGLFTGIYEFEGSKHEWLYEVYVEEGGKTKIKYIKEQQTTVHTWTPVYGEASVQQLRDGNHNRWIGRVSLPPRYNGAISFEQHVPSSLKVWIAGSEWVKSTKRREPPITATQPLQIGTLTLPVCCVEEFKTINKMPGLMGKVDFIGILGDVAGLVDAGNGVAQAINSLTQKIGTNGSPSLSTMLNPTVRLKIQERAISKIIMHRGTPLERFWNEVQRAWGSTP